MRFKDYLKDVMLNAIARSCFTPHPCRRFIFSSFHHSVSGTVYPLFFCGYGKGKLTVGKGSYTNYKCFFDLGDDITIGEKVSIAFGCTFINSFHDIGRPVKRGGIGRTLPIVVEDGCWIGANVTIMPGVTIAKGCVIGANSLVTKNTEPNGLYVGQPARRVKDLK